MRYLIPLLLLFVAGCGDNTAGTKATTATGRGQQGAQGRQGPQGPQGAQKGAQTGEQEDKGSKQGDHVFGVDPADKEDHRPSRNPKMVVINDFGNDQPFGVHDFCVLSKAEMTGRCQGSNGTCGVYYKDNQWYGISSEVSRCWGVICNAICFTYK